MRLFVITDNEKFQEYIKTPFEAKYEEKILENWIETNPDSIIEDENILIIGRQVRTDLGGAVDLLGVDRDGNVLVIELKRDKTPRDTIAQALEYASFVNQLEDSHLDDILCDYLDERDRTLEDYHREYYELNETEKVIFNKDQRIVVLGQNISQHIRQTASYLRSKNMRVTCIEFTFFQEENGTELLSQEIVVGREPTKPKNIISGSSRKVTKREFMDSLDENGKEIFAKIFDYAQQNDLPIHWGDKGFSLNTNVNGKDINIFMGYPPGSNPKQSIRTSFRSKNAGIIANTAIPDGVIADLWNKAERTGLFKPVGRELKCFIEQEMSEKQIDTILSWCDEVVQSIKKHGLQVQPNNMPEDGNEQGLGSVN